MKNDKIDLKGVHETLLMPLWGRATETKSKKPLLIDTEAVRIIDSINYDFTRIEKKVNQISKASWIARSIYFDEKIKDYLIKNPNGTIINIGCGLDTTYERVNNEKAIWYELDFPEVIEFRKQLIKETNNRIFLPFSVLDKKWYSLLNNKDFVIIMMAGVIYYFDENNVRRLFEMFINNFKTAIVIFDYSSKKGIQLANKKVIDESGMDKSSYLKWGVDDIKEIEKWDTKIKVIDNMKMFNDIKSKYPFKRKIGMSISDRLSIMSLARIIIE